MRFVSDLLTIVACAFIAMAFLTLCSGQPSAAGERMALLPCTDRAQALAILAERHDERLVGRGINNQGKLVEIAANPATGTWTLLVSPRPDFICEALNGDGWHAIERQTPAKPREGVY